jgi:hypothetical protein
MRRIGGNIWHHYQDIFGLQAVYLAMLLAFDKVIKQTVMQDFYLALHAMGADKLQALVCDVHN